VVPPRSRYRHAVNWIRCTARGHSQDYGVRDPQEVRWPRSTSAATPAALSDLLASDPEKAARVGARPHHRLPHQGSGRASARPLVNGQISDLADGDDPQAKIRLAVGSDDLLDLVAGRLNFASAWASGRVSVKASFGDLLKLRKLL
jgi:hypothetical protein